MLALNHAATGAIIALKINNPFLVLPLAFASHFVLDVLPHFGYKGRGFDYALTQKMTFFSSGMDAAGGLILLWLLWGAPLLVFAAGTAAVVPDLYNIFRTFVLQGGKELPYNKLNKFSQFHEKIQWFERPIGLIIEVIFFIPCAILISKLT